MIKKIALVGRSRVGKSRICSLFCKSKELVLKYFTGPGADCTPINFKYIVTRELKIEENETIVFISPESSLNGMRYNFDDNNIGKFLNSIKYDNKYSNTNTSELENKSYKKDLDPKKDYIEIITRPSEWALNFMESNNISQLVISDTPGVSGDIEGLENINNSDLYLFVMRPDNNIEFATSINKMIPTIGGSSVIYIYNMPYDIREESDYLEMKNDACKAIKDFIYSLEGIRNGDSIIDSSIEVLNPDSMVIPMGILNNRKEYLAEIKFKEVLAQTLKCKFNNNELLQLEKLIKIDLEDKENNQEALIEYIKDIANQYLIKYSSLISDNYVKSFLCEEHDRVKSNDKEQTLNAANNNRQKLLEELYKIYNKLTVDDSKVKNVPKTFQKTVIKYCYKKITISIKNDCGMSTGNHPWESQPPITMWALEAVIADDIIKNNATSSSNSYRTIMRKKGFTSKSWNCVSVYPKPYRGNESYCNRKLDIIKRCKLNSLPSKNIDEVIFNAYNLSLFKLGQYAIFDFIIKSIKSNDDPIDWIC